MTAARRGARLLVRPIRPEDEPAPAAFLARLTPDDVRFRFFGLARRLGFENRRREGGDAVEVRLSLRA